MSGKRMKKAPLSKPRLHARKMSVIGKSAYPAQPGGAAFSPGADAGTPAFPPAPPMVGDDTGAAGPPPPPMPGG
jgi:hypothetical protein